jgi:cytochrome c-type biogenesis protein
MYLGCYTLGFIVIFLIAGLFTNEVLRFLKKYRSAVRFTGILSGLVVGGMGIYLLAQGTQDYTSLLKAQPAAPSETADQGEDPEQADSETATTDQYDFELPDIYGNTVSLKDFKGQTVVLDFYETWCTYCNEGLGTLARADEMEDVKVLMIVTPKLGSEKTREGIRLFLKNEGHEFHLLYDEDGAVTRQFGVNGYPTTYFIKPDGEYYGYMPGYLPENEFLSIVEECRNSGKE